MTDWTLRDRLDTGGSAGRVRHDLNVLWLGEPKERIQARRYGTVNQLGPLALFDLDDVSRYKVGPTAQAIRGPGDFRLRTEGFPLAGRQAWGEGRWYHCLGYLWPIT